MPGFSVGPRLTTARVYWLVECCFTSTETVVLLVTGSQDGHLDFHTAPVLCRVHRTRTDIYSLHSMNTLPGETTVPGDSLLLLLFLP